jgi:hypothetical protein
LEICGQNVCPTLTLGNRISSRGPEIGRLAKNPA